MESEKISGYVSVTPHEGVLTICIDRPEKKNTITNSMWMDLTAALRSAVPRDFGAVVLKGNGGGFCAGNDIKEFLSDPPKDDSGPVFQFLRALIGVEVPVVVGVRGFAVGIGATMLLHCDLIYLAPDARLKLPFLDLGLVPEGGSSLLLPERLGRAAASRAIYLGEELDAPAALAAGLATSIVATDELDSVLTATARVLAAKPREALVATKNLLTGNKQRVLDAIEREGAAFRQRLASTECRRQLNALLSGR